MSKEGEVETGSKAGFKPAPTRFLPHMPLPHHTLYEEEDQAIVVRGELDQPTDGVEFPVVLEDSPSRLLKVCDLEGFVLLCYPGF